MSLDSFDISEEEEEEEEKIDTVHDLDSQSPISNNNSFVKKMTIYQRQKTIFKAISQAAKSFNEDEDNDYVDVKILNMDKNTDDFLCQN